MDTTIKNTGFKLTYNNSYDEEDGYYYVVKDLTDNRTVFACTGFQSTDEALETCQAQALKYWAEYTYLHRDHTGAKRFMDIHNLCESKTGKAF